MADLTTSANVDTFMGAANYAAMRTQLGLVIGTSVAAFKPAVYAVATADLTLANEQTIDGFLTSASIVLLTGQTDATQNGFWVTAASGWARPAWFAAGTNYTDNLATVLNGTRYGGSRWYAAGTINPNTTTQSWNELPLSAALALIDVIQSGISSAVDGSLILYNGSNGNSVRFLAGAPSADLSLNPPATTGTKTLITAQEVAAAYQPLDADLTAIAALTLAQNKFYARVGAGSGVADAVILVGSDFSLSGNTLALASSYQPLDPDLTSWAAITRASGFDTFTETPSGANLGALLTSALTVAKGGTGLTAGTSGGILYYSASGTLASSAALAANAIVVGGGAGATPATTLTGTGVLTFLGTPSSANLAAAVTDETGSGSLVFGTSPTITTPTISGAATLAENASIALDPAGSADGKYTGITVTATAGYTQAFGDLVYLDPTDSRWELCDANSAAGADGDSRGMIGMVVSAGTDGTTCTILLTGIIRADAKFPTFTVNNPIYVSETAGAVTQTQPTTTDAVIRFLGAALTADEMYFNPDWMYTTHT